MSIARTLADSVKTVDIEEAYEIAALLNGQERQELSNLTVFTGVHPEDGPMSVLIPSFGEGILFYQFVSQY